MEGEGQSRWRVGRQRLILVVMCCGCVVVWLCGCVVVWLCGCVVVWLFVQNMTDKLGEHVKLGEHDKLT
jgi:hypothetical protein